MKSQKTSDPKAVTKAIEHAWTTLKSRDLDVEKTTVDLTASLTVSGGAASRGRLGPQNVADADRSYLEGYLEGYLECSSAPVTVQRVRRYQAALNRHYSSGRHDDDKIANALQAVRIPLSKNKPTE
jgi:hypothetical protein